MGDGPDILDAVSGADDDSGEDLITVLPDLDPFHVVQVPEDYGSGSGLGSGQGSGSGSLSG